ncbi:sigma E protease regulator RseP [Pasteurellaceae bacterium LIM206]|nr:sigma E protease regulator RseP [Pasteurellaceae bacterium LIM206]
MSFLWSLISFLIVISVLVAVHEYGHFWAARKCGVKVQRFSIGFGKVLWKRTDKKGTEFALSAIPLGGYVKMLDERNEPVPESLKSQSFNSKSVLQRAFIAAAGPMANFIFAILAYWLVFSIGIPSVKPVIDSVKPASIAAQADIRPDWQILAVDGTPTPDWESVNMQLASKIGNHEVTLTVQPFGENYQRQKTLDLSHWTFDPDKQSAFGALGIVSKGNKVEMKLSKVVENSPAAKAGLQVGDRIFNQDGSDIQWQAFVRQVQEGKPIPLQVRREDKTAQSAVSNFQVLLTPQQTGDGKWQVGISPTVIPLADEYRTELKYGILDALQKGAEKTAELSWLTVKVLGKLFTGDLSLNNLSGPISIAKGAGISSSFGLVYYFSFMALISVNLGIMNLFPLPVLDGGHLVFLAAEGVMRKPVSEKIQNISYRLGAILLLMLTAFALFNDFLRL